MNGGLGTLTGATQTLPMLYSLYNSPTSYSQDFHDVTAGNNGTYTAGTGYDLDTGIGTPIANQLIPALAGGSLTYNAPSGTNNFRLVLSGANLDLYDNGNLVASQPVNQTLSVTISGGTDNTLLVDYSGGVFSQPVTFDGGSGTAVHTLTLNGGTFSNDTYAPTSATAGTMLLGSQTITFTDVNSVIDLDSVINYTINDISSADSINVVNGPSINGTTSMVVNSGSDSFTPVDFANKVNVTVLGLTGADTFTVNVSTPEVALATLNLDGGTTAGVVFNVQNTPSSVVTNVLGNSSGDTINVGSGGSVQGIGGVLNLNNSAGAKNTITVDDSADTVSQTVTLSKGSIQGLAPGVINYVAAGTQKLTIDGGSAGNFFNVQSANNGLAITVNGGTGSDTFNVTPLVSGTSVTLNGQAPTNAPGDTLVYNGPGTLHAGATGSGTITQTSRGNLAFTGMETVDVGIDLALSTVSVNPQTLPLGGGTATVTLTARDAFGNQETSGGLTVVFTLGSGSASGTFSNVTDNHNGTYTAVFTGTLVGTNTITTAIGTQVVPVTSADTINVTVGTFNTAESTVSVSPGSITSSGTATVTLTARDAFGNQETSGGLNVVFELGAGNASGTFGSVTDNHNGTYTDIFTGTIAGSNSITATINTEAVTSPDPTITVTPGAVSRAKSTVSVSPGTIASSGTATVTLTAEDAGGNLESNSSFTVGFGLTAGSASGTFGSVTNNNDGTYTAIFTGIIAGSDTITTTINTRAVTSPDPTLTVTPGAFSLAGSTVSVSPGSIASGGTSTVTLTARDAAGNLESNSSFTVGFGVGAGSASGTFGSVTNNHDGTYSAIFTGNLDGSNSITTTINTQAVTSTDPTITVTPGALSLAESTVAVSPGSIASGGTSTVTLTARDAAGNLESNSNYTVAFGLGTGGATGTFGNVTNNHDGTYSAIFTGILAGSNSITATINTQAVTSPDPTLTVTPGAVSLANSTVSVSPGSIASTGTATVTLTAEDAAGNLETGSSYTVGFGLSTGSASGTFSGVTNNNDGTYSAVFTGNLDGSNTITTTINTQDVTSTAPTITVTPGPVSLANSSVSVSASPASIPLNFVTTVTLTERDAAGNLETSGGDSVNFGLGSGSASGTFGAVTDKNNGTYTATFTSTILGTNTIVAAINTQAVTSAAATITVTPGPVSLAQSTVTVSPGSIVAGGTATITLTAEDAFGNVESGSSYNVVFGLGSGNASGTFSNVVNNHNGTFTAIFSGPLAGTNTITADINTQALTSTAPTITVTPGVVNLAQSTVSVSSASIPDGASATVTLTAEDAFGNVESGNGLNVVFGLGSGSAGGTFGAVTNNNNGTYTAIFTGTTVGTNTITATLGSQAVTSVEPAITVTPIVIALSGGDGQSTTVNTAFAKPLVATVTSAGVPLSGVTVTFANPGNGASVTFAGGSTATTNAQGQATVNVGANTVAGSYSVMASIAGVSNTVDFALTNNPGAPAAITADFVGLQSAVVNTAFAAPLVATVTDQFGNPISGVIVNFASPGSLAGVTFPNGSTATTDAQGQASLNVTANTSAGFYTVMASIAGVSKPASFALSNNPDVPAHIVVTSGGLQSTVVSTVFAAPLVATITDQFGNPISGLTVNFAGPGSGAGVAFPNGSTATTNAQGQASLNVSANSSVGSYTVTALLPDGSASASFSLTNQPAPVVGPVGIQPPVIGAIGTQGVNDGGTLSYAVKAISSDGSPLTFSLAAGAPAGATINAQTGLITWTPSENNGQAPGTYSFTVTVAQSDAPTAVSSTFTVLVGPSSINQGSGLASRIIVANGLTQSYEFYANVVTVAYAQYLKRTPDAMGLAFWVNKMQNGLSDEQIEAGFIGSPEFIADNGGGDESLCGDGPLPEPAGPCASAVRGPVLGQPTERRPDAAGGGAGLHHQSGTRGTNRASGLPAIPRPQRQRHRSGLLGQCVPQRRQQRTDHRRLCVVAGVLPGPRRQHRRLAVRQLSSHPQPPAGRGRLSGLAQPTPGVTHGPASAACGLKKLLVKP